MAGKLESPLSDGCDEKPAPRTRARRAAVAAVQNRPEDRPDGRVLAKARQSADSKERILNAAAIEFRAKGLSGARVVSIAKRVGMNVQALYHHFGNKDQLYGAVIERVFGREWDDAFGEKLASMPPAEALVFLWSYMFREFGAPNRAHLALIGDINTHRARHIKKSQSIRTYFRRVIDELERIIARGVAEGVFRDGVDGSYLYVLITGAQEAFLNNCYSLELILDRNLRTAAARTEWEAFLLDFISQAMARR